MSNEKTANIDRFGVFLPSFIWSDDGPERAKGIIDFAREVEVIGFNAIFITDHLLAAKQFYSVALMEPLTTLSTRPWCRTPALAARGIDAVNELCPRGR